MGPQRHLVLRPTNNTTSLAKMRLGTFPCTLYGIMGCTEKRKRIAKMCKAIYVFLSVYILVYFIYPVPKIETHSSMPCRGCHCKHLALNNICCANNQIWKQYL